jgi:predicted enzyme related to lactoylglutathione lyase
MTDTPALTAVLYAKHLARLTAFYQAVLGLAVVGEPAPDHVLLAAPGVALTLVAIPAAWADGIVLTDPPQRREDTPIKLSFAVPSLDDARSLAPTVGGQLASAEHTWRWGDWLVCDGTDPEGNVLQLREPA